MLLDEISRPTLLLNEGICRRNIQRMAQKTKAAGTGFNPHFKTHQSHEIGRWFREVGVGRITVSSIKMAEYFAADGWNDITVAFPLNLREREAIGKLASQVRLTLNVIDAETAQRLDAVLGHPVSVMVEVDAGYGRTGVPSGDFERISALLDDIQKSRWLGFYGFYIHAGHSYDVTGRDRVNAIHRQTLEALHRLKGQFADRFPNMKISLGDTPCCSMMDSFEGIDEVRPGNFVFYDATQQQIGSCSFGDVAVVLACPVVAKEPSRRELVIHGGAIHLSKDWMIGDDGKPSFGLPAFLTPKGWEMPEPGSYLRKLSQEHGLVKCTDHLYEKTEVGGLIAVYPVHSCLTADCIKQYLTLSGKTIGMMGL